MRIVKPSLCRTRHAYKRQPQKPKWTCTRCGKVPLEGRMFKDRQKGEPRANWVGFDTQEQLEIHVAQEHE